MQLKTALAASVLTLASGTLSVQAALIGTSVSGTLTFGSTTNYFNPSVGYVPTGYGYLNTAGPTVTVSEPATEFGFSDPGVNQDSANFTNSQLLIQDQSGSGFLNNVSFTMTFTDSAFAGQMPVLVTNTYPSPVSASITGTTLTVSFPAPALTTASPNTLSVTLFNIVAVPEPASLTAVGLVAVGLLRRRTGR